MMQDNNNWINTDLEQPSISGHYEIISKNGDRGYDDYTTVQKIWWNSNVRYWREINRESLIFPDSPPIQMVAETFGGLLINGHKI